MKPLNIPPVLLARWASLARGPDVHFMAALIALSLGVLGYFVHTLQNAMQRGPWQPSVQRVDPAAPKVGQQTVKLVVAEGAQAPRTTH
ncbi:MAG: hypothetical protein HY021_10640 [Burkholderiales bacterium]|nr:hypothetical protein [Burkholderiales bacterium]